MAALGTYASPLVNDAARDIADSLVVAVNTTVTVVSGVYAKVPGSAILARYVKASYQNDPYRSLLEACLVFFMVWYFASNKYKPGKQNKEIKLTEKEIQELIDEWEPEPLVQPVTDAQRLELDKQPIICGPSGPKLRLADGKERLNLASFNFLGAMSQESTKEKAIAAVRKHGVGTCGPCGFYGTIDVHINLEQEIARFMGVENAIVYSQGFTTVGSVIPAFAKRGDIIVADAGVSFAVQIGLQISRSIVKYYKHNDMEDLERVLQQLQKEFAAKKKPLTRRFIVTEGLSVNHADVCPLPQILELKHKYKYRLILEESFSLGVLGPRGAGVCDHFNIPPSEVDIITATLANALGSAGGFCCGSKEIVEHQRLGGQGYVFSASLPALLAVSAIEGIKYLEAHPEQLVRLRENSNTMRLALEKGVQGVDVQGEPGAPILHVRFKDPNVASRSRDDQERALQDCVDECIRNGVLVTRAKYVLDQEVNVPRPSIRVAITAAHTKKEVEKAAAVVAAAVKKTLKTIR
ncbi:serine palmitoyltransferase component [Thoreauomyces humboldtii]|nr:serine palmitoyltransferase component [Thoreauomyces humboldtii]